jgi:hypothetical protein
VPGAQQGRNRQEEGNKDPNEQTNELQQVKLDVNRHVPEE